MPIQSDFGRFRFIHRGTEAFELRQGIFARKGDRFGVREDVQRAFLKKDQVAQLVLLEVLPETKPVDHAGFVLRPKKKFVCLVNSHLLRSANPEHLTLLQLQTITYNMEQYFKSCVHYTILTYSCNNNNNNNNTNNSSLISRKSQYPNPAVIFCSDLNRQPHSSSYLFMETGDVQPDRLKDAYGKQTTDQMFAHSFKFKSVSKLLDGEPPFSSPSGTIDFMWYSENSLARTRWLSIPPGGLSRNTLSRPSPQLPSDHLPHIAEFGFLENPILAPK